VGLTQVTLKLNSLGAPADRARYVDALRAYLETNVGALSEQSKATLEKNPLRVLDSKRPEDAPIVAGAPRITDHLSDDAAQHFAQVTGGLTALGIPFTLEPRLVRGLDYYTRTTFEYAADALGVAQDAVGGGGRYDGLVEALGGPPTPGIGLALGVDRVLLACDAEGAFPAPSSAVDVFVVDVIDGTVATTLADAVRRAGLRADRAFDGRSMKSQMKRADASGAAIALIVGEQEVADGTVVVRDLRTSEQEAVARDDVIDRVRKLLG
jgi:histidyl-tRNA synthetase